MLGARSRAGTGAAVGIGRSRLTSRRISVDAGVMTMILGIVIFGAIAACYMILVQLSIDAYKDDLREIERRRQARLASLRPEGDDE